MLIWLFKSLGKQIEYGAINVSALPGFSLKYFNGLLIYCSSWFSGLRQSRCWAPGPRCPLGLWCWGKGQSLMGADGASWGSVPGLPGLLARSSECRQRPFRISGASGRKAGSWDLTENLCTVAAGICISSWTPVAHSSLQPWWLILPCANSAPGRGARCAVARPLFFNS